MKRIKKIIIFVVSMLLTVCIAVCGVLIYANVQPDVYQHTFTAALVDKYDRLMSINQKKIVLIGGSSMPFGMRSDLIEKELKDYKVVNFGLYAALGSKVMLELSLSNLGEGDIVIFAPEYSSQMWSEFFDAETVLQAFDERKSLAFKLPFAEFGMPLVNAYPEYLKNKAKLLDTGIPNPQDVYKRSAFNAYGDIFYNRPFNIMPDMYQPNDNITIDSNIIDSAFIDYFNKYTNNLKYRGVEVCISFAPINELSVKGSMPDQRFDFYDYCRNVFDADVISNIEDYVIESGYFYDSNYHLNDAGAIYRTALLVGDLKRANKDTSPIGIEIPDPPEIIESGSGEGEDNDGNEFVFETAENGKIAILALSEKGREQSYIKIPSYINGTAVYKLDEKALANVPMLERVDIPSTVKSLGNNLFEGSGKLTSVYLGLEPKLSVPLPSVGSDLLDGAPSALKIFVHSSQYARITTDYFWSQYAQRIEHMS